MKKEVLLLRHFDDQKTNNDYRNAAVEPSELVKVNMITDKIINALRSTNLSSVMFITSPLFRAIETAKIITNNLVNTDIDTSIEVDDRLKALQHGNYSKTDIATLQLTEKSAWKHFAEQAFTKGNLLYRHGDPIANGDSFVYPDIKGKFETFGENQLEFTLRFYSFLLDLKDVYKKNYDQGRLIVISSHLAPILRFNEMASLSDNGLPILRTSYIGNGRMYTAEWDQMEKIGKIISPGEITTFNIEKLIDYWPAIDTEITFLKALQVQSRR